MVPGSASIEQLVTRRLAGSLFAADFERCGPLLRAAATACGAEIALLALRDDDGVRIVACHGAPLPLVQAHSARKAVAHAFPGVACTEVTLTIEGADAGALCVLHPQPDMRAAALLADIAAGLQDLLECAARAASLATVGNEVAFPAVGYASPLGVFQATRDGEVFHASIRMQDLLGLPQAACMGTGWLAVVHPHEREATAQGWRAAVTQVKAFDTEFRLCRSDGRQADIRMRARPASWGQPLRQGFVGVVVDITDRKAVEHDLRRTNKFLERAERVSGVGGWEADLQRRAVKWTNQVARIYDLPPGHQPTFNEHRRFFSEESMRIQDAISSRAIAFGEAWDVELPMTTATGRELWVRSFGEAEFEHGKAVRLVGALLDVTQQHRERESLRATNTLLTTILDSLPCGLSVFDADLVLVAHNRKYRTLLGFPDELFAPKVVRFEDFIRFNALRGEYGEGDPEEIVRETVALARTWNTHHARRTRADGTVIEVRGEPMPGGGFVTTYVDLTSVLAAEEALRRSEERQKRAMDASGLVLWDLDLRSGRIYLSENWSQLRGGPRQPTDTTPEELLAIVPPSEHGRLQAALSAALSGESDRYVIEHPVHRLDGTLVWIHSEGRVTARDAQGWALHVTGTNKDITEARNAHAELVRAREAAEAANHAKTEFLDTMSHELRTPLNGILGVTRLLLEQPLAETHRRYLKLADTSATTLLELINDLLDLGKIEAGRMDFESIPFSLGELLRELGDLYSLRAGEKSLVFELEIAPDVPDGVLGDPVRLRQVLANLLSNAFKFTAEGEFGLRVERCATDPDKVRFTVTDSGIGIPPEVQARLFTRFTQANAATSRKYGGTGLGLAIVKQLCELMDGHVDVESSPGSGARFTCEVRLPAHALPVQSADTQEQALAPLRILAAEDNPTNQVMLQAILASAGQHDVTIVGDGRQAVDEALRGDFDVVLMDCRMPEMDGFDATRELRGRGYAGPILALTAGAGQHERERCLAAGMDDFLTKPIEKAVLLRALARHCAAGPEPAATAPAHEGAPDCVFDRQWLTETTEGDASFYAMVLDAYHSATPGLLDRIDEALGAADTEAVHRHLHSLAGTSATVGCRRLASTARTLEHAAGDGDLDSVRQGLAHLRCEVRVALDASMAA